MNSSQSEAALSVWASRNAALARIVPFAIYIAALALTPVIQEVLPGWDSRWFYALQVGAVLVALVVYARSYVEFSDAPTVAARDWGLALLIGALVFVLWINLDHPWITFGESKGFDPSRADGSLDWALIAVRIFGAAAVVPVMEELFWRSFVMRWVERHDFLRLAPTAVTLRALLISAVLFGVEHSLWFAGIVAGLAYGWLYVRSGSLWPPMIAHALTNLLLGVWVVMTGNWQFW